MVRRTLGIIKELQKDPKKLKLLSAEELAWLRRTYLADSSKEFQAEIDAEEDRRRMADVSEVKIVDNTQVNAPVRDAIMRDMSSLSEPYEYSTSSYSGPTPKKYLRYGMKWNAPKKRRRYAKKSQSKRRQMGRRRYKKRRRSSYGTYLRYKKQEDLFGKRRDYWQAIADGTIQPRGSQGSLQMFGRSRAFATDPQRDARDLYAFRGKGDYKSWAKYIPRGLGALGGAVMSSWARPGDLVGILNGARSGWDTGAKVSKFVGLGDYDRGMGPPNQIVGADVEGMKSQGSIAVANGNLSGDIFITQSEFLGNVIASGTGGTASSFEIRKFSINPALSATFPWLSQIAQNYILYEMQGLMFQYKPLSGEDPGTGINLGKIILATNYDPDAPDFATSFEMQNYDYANSTKPSCGLIHGVECSPAQNPQDMMYTRTGSSSKAKNFTDLGNFYVGTEGIPIPAAASSVIIGELWCAYTVRLSRANLYGVGSGKNVGYDAFRWTATVGSALASSTAIAANTLGCTLTNVSATQFTITIPKVAAERAFQIFIYTEHAANTPVLTSFTRNSTNFTFFLSGYSTGGTSATQLLMPNAALVGTTAEGMQTGVLAGQLGQDLVINVNKAALASSGNNFIYIYEVPVAMATIN